MNINILNRYIYFCHDLKLHLSLKILKVHINEKKVDVLVKRRKFGNDIKCLQGHVDLRGAQRGADDRVATDRKADIAIQGIVLIFLIE